MKSIKVNFFYNVVYQLFLIITPLITIPYVSRVLGPNNLGEFSYTYSISSYFVLIAMLGVKNYGNRSIAVVKDDPNKRSKIFYEIFIIQLFMSLMMLFFYFVYVIKFNNNQLLYIQSIYLIAALLDISWFYFGMEEFKFTAIRSILVKLVSVISIFIFIKSEDDIYIYTVILALSTLFSQFPLWVSLHKYISFKIPKKLEIRDHIKPNLILFMPVLAISMYNILDKIMLGTMSTMEETAFFESAEKIVNVPFGVITALGAVMLPRTAYLIKNGNEDKSMFYLEISMKYILILSFAMTFGISAVSPMFTPIFFGKSFTPVIILIQLISPTIFLKAWANVIRTQFLIPRSRDRDYVFSVFLGACVNIISNLYLIPQYGAKGAVISTVLAELSVAFYQTYKVRSELPIMKYVKNSYPFLIGGLVMYTVINTIATSINNSIINLTVLIVLGAVIYTTICLMIFYLRDELHLLKTIFEKRN